VTIGVRTNDPLIVDELRARLPYGARPSTAKKVDFLFSLLVGRQRRAGVRSFHLLYSDGTQAARSLDLREVLDAFASRLRMTVAEHSKRVLFVHAAVVEWNGSAILIPGPSFSGKSTLALAFVNAGARYYSDEYAIVDESGLISPFLQPISIRNDDGEAYAVKISGSVGPPAISVGWILVTTFRAGSRWRPRIMTPGEALLALLANTVPARSRPHDAFAAFDRIVNEAVALKSARGEADEMVRAFIERASAQMTTTPAKPPRR
jgi:hypothetical protein